MVGRRRGRMGRRRGVVGRRGRMVALSLFKVFISAIHQARATR